MSDQQGRPGNNALIMVAPNGARRTRQDHPELPVTVPQIAETADDFTVEELVPMKVAATSHSKAYLDTKVTKMRHKI